jgi:hypothetical protein
MAEWRLSTMDREEIISEIAVRRPQHQMSTGIVDGTSPVFSNE